MIEKLIIALDSQRLGALQACLRRYDLRFNVNLDKGEMSDAIKMGSFFHELLRYYYLGKQKGELILTDNLHVVNPIQSDKKLSVYQLRDQSIPLARRKIPEIGINDDLVTTCITTFHEYVDNYSGEDWNIIGVEEPFSVVLHEDDIPFKLKDKEYSGLVILWEGIIDLEVTRSIDSFPVDHKTGQRRNYPDELTNQFLGYAYKSGHDLVCVNQIEFKKDPDKFHRPFLLYSSHLVDEFVESVVEAVKKDYFYALNIDKWPPNFHSCNQKFACVFTDLCKEKDKAHILSMKYKIVEPWDPFKRDN